MRIRRRRDRPRSRTTPVKKITRALLAAGREELRGELVQHASTPRPLTWGECGEVLADGPCPWVACKHHLYLDVNPETGAIKINFPDLEVDELAESCSLDIAHRGGLTLEATGAVMNLTRERTRQIEIVAYLKLARGPLRAIR